MKLEGRGNSITVTSDKLIRELENMKKKGLKYVEQPKDLRRDSDSDGYEAPPPNPATPGGIDLDPALLDLQIRRDSRGVPLPLPQQPIQNMKIDGFLPIIINITPVTSLPLLSNVNNPCMEMSKI